jgi:hydroxymethylglutaryl-CoA lyase
MAETVIVCEVGPRNGLQMSKTRMATAAKLSWIEAIAAAGVPEIEVGSFVPPRLVPQMADTAEVVQATRGLPAVIVALVPNRRGAHKTFRRAA